MHRAAAGTLRLTLRGVPPVVFKAIARSGSERRTVMVDGAYLRSPGHSLTLAHATKGCGGKSRPSSSASATSRPGYATSPRPIRFPSPRCARASAALAKSGGVVGG